MLRRKVPETWLVFKNAALNNITTNRPEFVLEKQTGAKKTLMLHMNIHSCGLNSGGATDRVFQLDTFGSFEPFGVFLRNHTLEKLLF